MRLDKYLAHAGYGSRMQVKKIIKKGIVTIDDVLCMDPSVEITTQKVYVNEEAVHYEEFYYVMMNKPFGVLSASKDKKQTTVNDLLNDEIPLQVHVVGRLDKDSTGLLLLTNDGYLAHQLLSPKNKRPKVYLVTTDNRLTKEQIHTLEHGILLDGAMTLPCEIAYVEDTTYKITLYEGRFHQIKRMIKYLGLSVQRLHRVQIATLQLDRDLKPGDYRFLTKSERDLLYGIRR